MGVVVSGARVLAGGIGVVAVAVGRTGVEVACTGSDVGVAGAGAGVRVQAVAARMIPIATSKSPNLFPLIVKPPYFMWRASWERPPPAQKAALHYHIPKPVSWAIQE